MVDLGMFLGPKIIHGNLSIHREREIRGFRRFHNNRLIRRTMEMEDDRDQKRRRDDEFDDHIERVIVS